MKNNRNVSIYIPDHLLYSNLYDEIRDLYYKKYGQTLSRGEVIIKSMLMLKDSLTAETKQEQLKVSRLFK
jgi:hypothetical protein